MMNDSLTCGMPVIVGAHLTGFSWDSIEVESGWNPVSDRVFQTNLRGPCRYGPNTKNRW